MTLIVSTPVQVFESFDCRFKYSKVLIADLGTHFIVSLKHVKARGGVEGVLFSYQKQQLNISLNRF